MMYLGDQAVGIACNRDFNPLKYAYKLDYLYYNKELPETVILDFENNTITSLIQSFYQTTGVKTIIIKDLICPENGIDLHQTFRDSSVETIIFNQPFKFARSSRAFSNDTIKHIIGVLDFSTNTSSSDCIYFSRNLEGITIKPSTIKSNFYFTGCSKLNNNSLISFANGLDETANEQSLHAYYNDYLLTMANLMGNNNNGLFVADENGSISLSNFITTIKGWTLTI